MLKLIDALKAMLGYIPLKKWVLYIGVAFALALSEGLGFLILIPLLTSTAENAGPVLSQLHGAGFASANLDTDQRMLMGLLIFFFLFAIRSVLTLVQKRMGFALEIQIVDPFRLKLLGAIQNTEWEFISGRKQGDFLDLFNTTLLRFAGTVQLMLALSVAALSLLVYIGLLIWSSPAMSASALALISPLFLLAVWKNRQIVALGHDITAHSKVLQHRLHESLGTLRISRRQTLKNWHWNLMDKAQNTMRASQYSFMKIQSNLQMVFQLLGAALLCGYLYLALVVLKAPLSDLSLLVLGFARLYPLVTRVQQMIQSLKFASPSVETLKNELDWLHQHREPTASIRPAPVNTPSRNAFPDIHLNNIELSYERDENHYSLQIDAIKIPAGSLCCIVGPSGQGKSTLLDLLAGVSQPRSGHLQLGASNINDTRQFLRESSRYVTQDNPLIHGTIRDNLLMGNQAVSDDELRQCLQRINGNFVFELPDALDTQVGDRGQQLSGGQKQRLLLANALLDRPALLILDEATSALDRDSEEAVQQTLQQLAGECTIIMVSHRRSTLAQANVLISVNAGKARLCELEEARKFCV